MCYISGDSALTGFEVEHELTLGGIALRLGAIAILIIANAFFVAAEFALVGARRSRIDQMAETGDRSAKRVQQILKQLDLYISSAQLGITLASLALGFIGEATLAVIIDMLLGAAGVDAPPAATHTTAAIITAYVLLTFLHITLGEQTPKSIAIVSAERLARWCSLPLLLFTKLMMPFIWVLNTFNNFLLKLIHVPRVTETAHLVHSPEELRLLVYQARQHGTLDESDSAMIAGVFDFHEKRARDVMRPRTEIVALPIDASEDEVWKVLRSERYSRYPVYEDSLDDMVGVFLAKDLWLHDGSEPFDLKSFVREAIYVPDSRQAERVLDDLRKTRAHMAVVLDEYGGTAGVLTMEDLVEEVIGDIADEYDMATRDSITTDGVLELSGSLSLIDVRSDYRLPIPEGDWTTLGGYAFSRLGRVPKVGDRVPFPGGELEVVAMDGRRVAALRILYASKDRVPA
jgi:CBS domain containing-hemolysin-like protein